MLALISAAGTGLRAELTAPEALPQARRAFYDNVSRTLARVTGLRDSIEQVYAGIAWRLQGDRTAVYNEQRRVLRELESIDNNIASCQAMLRFARTGDSATPAEVQATALMVINCIDKEQAISFIDSNIDKASPFLYNWLALRAMEAGDYVKAYRSLCAGIKKMAEPDEVLYYPLFHNLGMFLSRTSPYITPEQVKRTQADLDNNRRICVEQYVKAVPFFLKDTGTTIYSLPEYLTPHGPYAPGINFTIGVENGLINGITLAKEYEHYNLTAKRAARKSTTQKSRKSTNRP